jgi:3-polyprenyl-4-hydroxybenzoate decarboxylase
LRYALLHSLTVTEVGPEELEIVFRGGEEEKERQDLQEKGGEEKAAAASAAATAAPARCISAPPSSPSVPNRRGISRVVICPCSATEVKGAIMRMLTRLHLEREFRVGGGGGGGREGGGGGAAGAAEA